VPTTSRRSFRHNWISYVGAVTAILAFAAFVFLLIFHALGGAVHAPYAGLVIFILIPAFLIFGLLLIPVGMLFEWWRWKRHKAPSIPEYPELDLNNPRHRRAVLIFGTVSLVLVFLSVYGSYQALQYTESVAFCGTLCHRVMQPEYVSHKYSAHARVRCVDCHVGPGAGAFFRSKMQGVVQVYDVATHSYPRPIPFPIINLRPARAICEQCHWPEKFFGAQEIKTVHFLPDKQNTRWVISLLLKVGGGGPWNPGARGIHWHVGRYTRIEFIATEEQLQTIPWVRYVDLRTGKATVYTASGAPPADQIPASKIHTMDCMDCHDRPTHIFRSPSDLVNRAMAAGYIDPALPGVKNVGATLLAENYGSTQVALKAIAHGMNSYYTKNYPEVARERSAQLSAAVSWLQAAYRENFFPYMKVRWDTYADNIGHLNSLGCYRCHDGLHKSPDGHVIGKNCTKCHTIIQQGTPGKMSFSTEPEGLAFQHPESIGGLWQTMNCSDCHTGVAP
jgi:hypothetical protein